MQIFISYSHADTEFANRLRESLEQGGYSVWIDDTDIEPGELWDDEIVNGLKESDVFLVILSPASAASINVKNEIGYALEKNKKLIPILYKKCELPFRLRDYQYIDFTTLPYEKGLQKVLSKLAAIRQNNKPSETPPIVKPPPIPDPQPGCSGRIGQWIFAIQRRPAARRIMLVLLAAVIILGVIAAALRSIPKTLVITVSNETSIDVVKTFPPIRVTSETTTLDSLAVKGDSPITVNIQALNLYGSEIPSDVLVYQWILCCNDKHNKTTDAGHLSSWQFEPPTDLANETLTVTVSNKWGYGIEAMIPFTITIR